MKLPTVDENELIGSICKESFYEFLVEFWDIVVQEPLVKNWHIKYLCDELQLIAERVFDGLPKLYDLVINISPGSTKSTIGSIMYPAWIWTRKPSARFIGGSYAHNLSMDLSRKNRLLVKSEKYRACFPDVQISDSQDAKFYFVNTKGGERYSVGTGGSVTGMHGHFILIDDPVNPEEASSEEKLKIANRWMDETISTRKVDKAITPVILIMQRLHQNDCTYNKISKGKDRVKHICLPAEVTPKINPPELVKFYKDGLMDIVRLPKDVLEENRKQIGEFGYAGQFLQDPIPIGGGMFKVDRIKIEENIPQKWVRRVRYWDKAATQDGKGAYTVGVLMGKDINGRFWVLDVIRGRWDSSKRESVIKQVADMDGRIVVIGIEQEPGSGGKESAQSTIRNLAGYRVKVNRPVGEKSVRADPYSIQVNNGNVFMKSGEWNKEYMEELSFFPFSKYKDQVDASSGAFTLLTKTLVVGGF